MGIQHGETLECPCPCHASGGSCAMCASMEGGGAGEAILITDSNNEMKKDNTRKTALSILTGALTIGGVVGVLLIFYFSISIHIINTAAMAQNIPSASIVIDSNNSNEAQHTVYSLAGQSSNVIEEKNKALVLKAFDTLFNQRDYVAAERYWSPKYIQHSAHIQPGREGLFNLVKSSPSTLKYEPGTIVADGDFVIVHGRFSGMGQPVNWIAADILRIKDGIMVEHWDVIQDEATQEQSKSGLPMFGGNFSNPSEND